jgi:uncharacterized membrane protein (UPF0127 family)
MKVTVKNHSRSLEKPLRVKNCETFLCRLKGLMFTNHIDLEDGLLLVHEAESKTNAAIHMFFVGMDLGVIWLDKNKQVVSLVRAKSWRAMYSPQAPAMYILEVHPDRLAEFRLGDKLSFE